MFYLQTHHSANEKYYLANFICTAEMKKKRVFKVKGKSEGMQIQN